MIPQRNQEPSMNRVINILIITSLFFLGWDSAAGQSKEPLVKLEHEIEAARKLMRTERKLVIAGELFLTPKESKAFWPVYTEYETAAMKIGDEKLRLITEYADNFDQITPEYAERLLKESFDINSRQMELRRNYIKKFKKVLPVIKVVRLYQIDSKLNAVLDYQLAAGIPLVQDGGKELKRCRN
jgi:hypothetical protein